MIALVILAAAGCLALGWWQWGRFESASGTFQNLGYALQWPFFAGFCVYAYFKFVRLEENPEEAIAPPEVPTEIPQDLLPQRPGTAARDTADSDDTDATLADYNAYLAALAQQDAELAQQTTEVTPNDSPQDHEQQDRTTA